MGLPVPDLPTDNLYKFATIAGIALVGFGVFVLEREATLKLERIRDVGGRVAATRAHLDNLNETIARAARKADKLTERTGETNQRFDGIVRDSDRSKGTSRGMREQSDLVLKVLVELKSGIKDIEKDLVAIGGTKAAVHEEVLKVTEEQRLLDTYDELSVLNTRGGLGLSILGMLTAFWGLWCWYYKVQVFQDRALRVEAEAARGSRDKHTISYGEVNDMDRNEMGAAG